MEILDRIDWASELALCRRVDGARFFLNLDRCAALLQTDFPHRCSVGPTVCGRLRILDLLPAWFAAADVDNRREGAGLSPPQRTTLSAPMRSRRPNGVFVLLSSRYGLYRLIKRRRRDAKLINLARRTHRRLCKETRRLPRVL